MSDTAKIVLSKPTEYQIRNTVLMVYPVSLEKIILISEKMEQLEKAKKVAEQAELMLQIVYELVKEDNKGVSLEELRKILTLEAGMKIISTAMGSDTVKA